MTDFAARVDQVKQRVALSALIGRAVKLTKRGREWSGLCPFHSERTPSFTVNDDKGFYHCFGCGAHGDAIAFRQEHAGETFIAALEALESDAGLAQVSATRRESAKADRQVELVSGIEAASWAWREAQAAAGTLVETWFRGRGIDPAASGILDVVRFLPDAPAALWRRDASPASVRRRAAAMVAPLVKVRGPRGDRSLTLAGVHMTFLTAEGGKMIFPEQRGKRPPSRLMWGAGKGAAVPILSSPRGDSSGADAPAGRCGRPVGLAVPPPGPDLSERICAAIDQGDRLVIAEGLESTLSLLAKDKLRPRKPLLAFATLSLGNLEGAARRIGSPQFLPLWSLKGAEQGAPFTIEDPGAVLIGVDSDMKPVKARVQERPRGPVIERQLTGMERAEICGVLAAWHWRRAGASLVEAVRAPMGEDFNDSDRRAA